MQTIGIRVNNAASAVIEGKETMRKDLGRGGRRGMAWLILLVCGFSILVKIFDSFVFGDGQDQSGVGEICLFATFMIGVAVSQLNISGQCKAPKLMPATRQQGKRGAETPQPNSASIETTSETPLKAAAKTRKADPQVRQGSSVKGASASINGTSPGTLPPWRAAAQRRGANSSRSATQSWTKEEGASRCHSNSVEMAKCKLETGSELDAIDLAQGITACCEGGNMELAEKQFGSLMRLAPSVLKSITTAHIHTLVEAGIKAGAARKVAAWLGQMHAGGLQLHAKTLLAVLEALCAIQEVAQAEQLLSRMEAADAQVDIACYQWLFEHCIPEGSKENVSRAEMWLQRIGRRGAAQLAQGYTGLIRARGSAGLGNKEEAVKSAARVESNRARQLEFWMNHALAAGVTRSTQCYNAVIHAFARVGNTEKAEAWLQSMEKAAKEAADHQAHDEVGADSRMHFGPDLYSYTAIMDAYAEQGESTRAEACFERMKAAGVRPDVVSFNTVVKAHARSGNILGAEQWLVRARKHSVQVDSHGYNAVIAAAARNGEPATAERWLCRMHEEGACPDVVSYNAVINAWAKRSDARRAERLVIRMCENGIEPDVVTMGAAVHACAKAGDLARAESIFSRIVSRGFTRPDAICYNAMIDAFVKMNDISAAEQWLSSMVRDGITPSVVSYTTVLHAHARVGDIDAAERGLEHMLASGIEANVVSYSALIHACVKAGDIERAEKCFERMRAAGIKPNAVSYSVLLNVCAKAGDFVRAEYWLEDMCNAGLQPNAVCYNNVIDACAKSARGERAEAWLRRLIDAGRKQKVERSAERSVAGHARAARGAGNISRDAEGELLPTRQSYTTAAQAYATHGLWNDVERIFAEMEDSGLTTDEFSLTVMLSAYARARPRQRDRAELCFRRHIARGVPVTRPPLRALKSVLGTQRCNSLCDELQVPSPQ